MTTPTTVVPVAWVNVVDTYEGPYDFYGVVYLPAGKTNLYSQATVDALQKRIDEFAEFRAEAAKLADDYFALNSQRAALQERIDELEAQLFIARAEPAVALFDVMHLEPCAFPSIRTNPTERTT